MFGLRLQIHPTGEGPLWIITPGRVVQEHADVLEAVKRETLVLCLFFHFQAHLRRHVQVHKRTENYSPRQRKLRSVIVHEVDMNPSEHEHPEEADASLSSEEPGYVPGTSKEPDTDGGLQPGRDSRHVVMEQVVTNQELGEDAAAESFSVSEVLQQTQLVGSCGPPVQ